MGLGLQDATNYILFTNPLSRGVTSSVVGLGRMTGIVGSEVAVQPVILPTLNALVGNRQVFIRLAAIGAASSIALHLFFSHRLHRHEVKQTDMDREQYRIFQTANNYHFLHSLALLSMPLVRSPVFTSTMLIIGTSMFSGSGYYRALGGSHNVSVVTMSGSSCLIMAWLSMLW